MLHFFFYEFYMLYILCFNLDNHYINVAFCISGNMGQGVQMSLVLHLNPTFSLEFISIQMLVRKT